MRYLVLAALLLSNAAAFAQTVAPERRDYDVRDLLIDIPDFGPGPALGIQTDPPAAAGPVPEKTPATERLLRTVRSILRDDPAAKAAEAAGSLRLDASAAQHERVRRAFDQARQARGTQITVETRFMTFTPATIAALPADLQQMIDATAFGEETATLDASQRTALFAATPVNSDHAVPRLQEIAFLKSAAGRPREAVHLVAPKVTVFQSQQTHVLIVRDTLYVPDLKPNAAPTAEEPFLPIIGTIKTGLSVAVRAGCDDKTPTVALSVRPQLARLLDITAEVSPRSLPDQAAYIQVPQVRVDSADRLLTLASGRSALIRLRPSGEGPAPSDEVAFAIVTPTIIRPGQSLSEGSK